MGINPLQQPPSYAIDIPDPAQEFLKGQITAMKMEEAMAEREAKRLSLIQQQELNGRLRELFSNPRATGDDYARILPFLPKDQANMVKTSWDMLDETKKAQSLASAAKVYSALHSGSVDVAEQLLAEQLAAYTNQGRKQEAAGVQTYIDLMKVNPNAAKTTIGLMLAQIPGGDKVLNAATTGATQEADAAYRALMAGANTVDDVFDRIPALAQMGEKGIGYANQLLTQQRLYEKQAIDVAETKAREAEEKAKTIGAISMLNSLFPGAAISTAEAPPTEKAAAADRPIQLAAIDGTVSDAPRGLFTLTKTGEIEGTLHLDRLLAQGKLPQMDQTKANALGLSPEIQTVIMGMAQSNPKGAAKIMVDVVNAKIKQDMAQAKPATLSPYAKMLVEAGYQVGSPDFQAKMRKHTEAETAGKTKPLVALHESSKKSGGEYGENIGRWFDQATEGADQLRNIDRYKARIGGAITGPMAGARMTAAQIVNMLGFSGDSALSDSRELIQGMSEMTLAARGMLKGQGQITEGETKLLERARSGDISMTPPELNTLLDVIGRATTARTERATRMLRGAAKDNEVARRYLEEVEYSAYTPRTAPGKAAGAPTAPRNLKVDY